MQQGRPQCDILLKLDKPPSRKNNKNRNVHRRLIEPLVPWLLLDSTTDPSLAKAKAKLTFGVAPLKTQSILCSQMLKAPEMTRE